MSTESARPCRVPAEYHDSRPTQYGDPPGEGLKGDILRRQCGCPCCRGAPRSRMDPRFPRTASPDMWHPRDEWS